MKRISKAAVALLALSTLGSCGYSPDSSTANLHAEAKKTYNYVCYPTKKDPNQSSYLLDVSGDEISLGYSVSEGNEMKKAKKEENRNKSKLGKYIQYGGDISKLVGEGSLKAYLEPVLLTGGKKIKDEKGGEMILSWGRATSIETSFACTFLPLGR